MDKPIRPSLSWYKPDILIATDETQSTNGYKSTTAFIICTIGMDQHAAAFTNGIRSCVLDNTLCLPLYLKLPNVNKSDLARFQRTCF